MGRKVVRPYSKLMDEIQRLEQKDSDIREYFSPASLKEDDLSLNIKKKTGDKKDSLSFSKARPASAPKAQGSKHRYSEFLDWKDDIISIINVDKIDGGARLLGRKSIVEPSNANALRAALRGVEKKLQETDPDNALFHSGRNESSKFNSKLIADYLNRTLSKVNGGIPGGVSTGGSNGSNGSKIISGQNYNAAVPAGLQQHQTAYGHNMSNLSNGTLNFSRPSSAPPTNDAIQSNNGSNSARRQSVRFNLGVSMVSSSPFDEGGDGGSGGGDGHSNRQNGAKHLGGGNPNALHHSQQHYNYNSGNRNSNNNHVLNSHKKNANSLGCASISEYDEDLGIIEVEEGLDDSRAATDASFRQVKTAAYAEISGSFLDLDPNLFEQYAFTSSWQSTRPLSSDAQILYYGHRIKQRPKSGSSIASAGGGGGGGGGNGGGGGGGGVRGEGCNSPSLSHLHLSPSNRPTNSFTAVNPSFHLSSPQSQSLQSSTALSPRAPRPQSALVGSGLGSRSSGGVSSSSFSSRPRSASAAEAADLGFQKGELTQSRPKKGPSNLPIPRKSISGPSLVSTRGLAFAVRQLQEGEGKGERGGGDEGGGGIGSRIGMQNLGAILKRKNEERAEGGGGESNDASFLNGDSRFQVKKDDQIDVLHGADYGSLDRSVAGRSFSNGLDSKALDSNPQMNQNTRSSSVNQGNNNDANDNSNSNSNIDQRISAFIDSSDPSRVSNNTYSSHFRKQSSSLPPSPLLPPEQQQKQQQQQHQTAIYNDPAFITGPEALVNAAIGGRVMSAARKRNTALDSARRAMWQQMSESCGIDPLNLESTEPDLSGVGLAAYLESRGGEAAGREGGGIDRANGGEKERDRRGEGNEREHKSRGLDAHCKSQDQEEGTLEDDPPLGLGAENLTAPLDTSNSTPLQMAGKHATSDDARESGLDPATDLQNPQKKTLTAHLEFRSNYDALAALSAASRRKAYVECGTRDSVGSEGGDSEDKDTSAIVGYENRKVQWHPAVQSPRTDTPSLPPSPSPSPSHPFVVPPLALVGPLSPSYRDSEMASEFSFGAREGGDGGGGGDVEDVGGEGGEVKRGASGRRASSPISKGGGGGGGVGWGGRMGQAGKAGKSGGEAGVNDRGGKEVSGLEKVNSFNFHAQSSSRSSPHSPTMMPNHPNFGHDDSYPNDVDPATTTYASSDAGIISSNHAFAQHQYQHHHHQHHYKKNSNNNNTNNDDANRDNEEAKGHWEIRALAAREAALKSAAAAPYVSNRGHDVLLERSGMALVSQQLYMKRGRVERIRAPSTPEPALDSSAGDDRWGRGGEGGDKGEGRRRRGDQAVDPNKCNSHYGSNAKSNRTFGDPNPSFPFPFAPSSSAPSSSAPSSSAPSSPRPPSTSLRSGISPSAPEYYLLTARVEERELDDLGGWQFNVYLSQIDCRTLTIRRCCVAESTFADIDGHVVVPVSMQAIFPSSSSSSSPSSSSFPPSSPPSLSSSPLSPPLSSPPPPPQTPLRKLPSFSSTSPPPLTHLISPAELLPWIRDPKELFENWIRVEAFAVIPEARKVVDSMVYMGPHGHAPPTATEPDLTKYRVVPVRTMGSRHSGGPKQGGGRGEGGVWEKGEGEGEEGRLENGEEAYKKFQEKVVINNNNNSNNNNNNNNNDKMIKDTSVTANASANTVPHSPLRKGILPIGSKGVLGPFGKGRNVGRPASASAAAALAVAIATADPRRQVPLPVSSRREEGGDEEVARGRGWIEEEGHTVNEVKEGRERREPPLEFGEVVNDVDNDDNSKRDKYYMNLTNQKSTNIGTTVVRQRPMSASTGVGGSGGGGIKTSVCGYRMFVPGLGMPTIDSSSKKGKPGSAKGLRKNLQG